MIKEYSPCFYFISSLKNLFQLDIPDNGEREEVVEGLLGLHLLLVELLHLLDHLFGENLRWGVLSLKNGGIYIQDHCNKPVSR